MSRPQHDVTDDTVLLWRLSGNTTSLLGTGITDAVGTKHLTGSAAYLAEGPDGAGAGKRSVWFGFTEQEQAFAAGTDVVAMLGNWTIKGWVRIVDISSAQHSLLAYWDGTATAAAASNRALEIAVTTGGVLRVIWEHTTRTVVTTNAPSGTLLDATWHHIAIVKENGTTGKKLTFYLDGADLGTVDNITNADGAADAIWRAAISVNEDLAMRSILVKAAAATDAEIAADYARRVGANAYTHIDSGPIHHWKCDDTVMVPDEAGGYHLSQKFAGVAVSLASALADDGGYGWLINDPATADDEGSGGAATLRGAANDASTLLAALHGDFTFEVYLRLGSDFEDVGGRGLFNLGIDGAITATGGASEDNAFWIGLSALGEVQIDYLYGAGVLNAVLSSAVIDPTDKTSIFHLGVTKTVIAGDAFFTVYVDNLRVWQSTAQPNYDGGEAWREFGLGGENCGDDVHMVWCGTLDDARLRSTADGAPVSPGGPYPCDAPGDDLPKIEGRYTVPAAGLRMTVNYDGNGEATLEVLTGGASYWPTSSSSFLGNIGGVLNIWLGGDIELTVDDDGANPTGFVTISATDPFTVSWPDIKLRELLGFAAGDLSGSNSYTGTLPCPNIWLPDRRRWLPPDPEGSIGRPISDTSILISPSGHSARLSFGTRYATTLEFHYVAGNRMRRELELVAGESFQSFFERIVAVGEPIRYHYDRADNYRHVSWIMMPVFLVAPDVAGWTGIGCAGPDAYYGLGPVDVVEYKAP